MKSTKSEREAITPSEIRNFRTKVLRHFRVGGRHALPWRNLPAGRQGRNDAYRIMVSEVMLQQTQVSRVVPKYQEFIKAFPTVRKLAYAKFADVLRLWSGLGYNRRAKYLHDAAKAIVRDYVGRMPKTAEELEKLPGIGHYSARAICAFAYNTPSVFLETNIRTALIHHFFPAQKKVGDKELLLLAAATAHGQSPREWYSALMDYGAHLKATEGNASRRSSGYKKQSKFAGSLRQTRGEVLYALQTGRKSVAALGKEVSRPKQLEAALVGLRKDGIVLKKRGGWSLV